jgi:endonuclease/exonuclease/phosphatase family metal-dependent hydrolase
MTLAKLRTVDASKSPAVATITSSQALTIPPPSPPFAISLVAAMQLQKPNPLAIRLLSHNIRYATGSPFKGEKPWATRRPHLINELAFNTRHNAPAFICLQEVLHSQLVDIIDGLNGPPSDEQQWAYIGVGRDDGKEAGEYSPILYRPSVWELVFNKNIWLSETPDKPSKGWDAASIRILTIGIFKHRESGHKILALNTHLDDQGSRSRFEAAKMIVSAAMTYSRLIWHDEVLLYFVAGDFNSEPSQEAYEYMTAERSPVVDLMHFAPISERYGDTSTFTGFEGKEKDKSRIDFLFLGPKGRVIGSVEERTKDEEDQYRIWHVDGYAVLENKFEDGVYNSDHRAVVGDVLLI